jgi:hypothetical protein
MKAALYGLALVLGLFTAVSCRDIIEKDLSSSRVKVNNPAEGFSTKQSTVNFWWEEVQYSEAYNLQIVSPSFSNIQRFVLDSNVTSTRFMYSLPPGLYQWRVRAQNGSSATPYATYSFAVVSDTSTDLTGETVQLLSPAPGFYAGQKRQSFLWNTTNLNSRAEDYRFQVLSGSQVLFTNASIKADSISFEFPADGEYVWQVRAQNSSSVTPYTSRIITVDTKIPGKPVPVYSTPPTDTITSFPYTVAWTLSDAGSPITDSIYFYSDSTLATSKIIVSDVSTDKTYPVSNNAGKFVQGRRYFWRVISVDAAGNRGVYSDAGRLYYK